MDEENLIQISDRRFNSLSLISLCLYNGQNYL